MICLCYDLPLPLFNFAALLLRGKKRKIVVREQGRYVQKASAGKEFAQKIPSVLPQSEAGVSGARRGAPTSDQPCSWRKKDLPARPKK
jgi:hypothetical protein